jgi:hypothetical protein
LLKWVKLYCSRAWGHEPLARGVAIGRPGRRLQYEAGGAEQGNRSAAGSWPGRGARGCFPSGQAAVRGAKSYWGNKLREQFSKWRRNLENRSMRIVSREILLAGSRNMGCAPGPGETVWDEARATSVCFFWRGGCWKCRFGYVRDGGTN